MFIIIFHYLGLKKFGGFFPLFISGLYLYW